jgi:hypothetical protein
MRKLEILRTYLISLRDLLKSEKYGYPVYNIKFIYPDPFYGLISRQIESAAEGDENTIQTQDWEFVHQKQLKTIPDYKDFNQVGLLKFVENSINTLQIEKIENENELKEAVQRIQHDLNEFRENRENESLNGRKLPNIQERDTFEDGFLSL